MSRPKVAFLHSRNRQIPTKHSRAGVRALSLSFATTTKHLQTSRHEHLDFPTSTHLSTWLTTRDRGEAEEATIITITAGRDTEVRLNLGFATGSTRLTISAEEDDYDRRPQRRRYEEPLEDRVRKQLLSIAESPLKPIEEEINSIAKTVCDNYQDEQLRNGFFDLLLQLVVEQPFKTPFLAAVVVTVNTLKGELAAEILTRTAHRTNLKIKEGEWREVKLLMKFLGSLQGLLEGEGVWSVLQDLFTKAVDLQTENNEEVSICFRYAELKANRNCFRLLALSWSKLSSLPSPISCLRQHKETRRRLRVWLKTRISSRLNPMFCKL